MINAVRFYFSNNLSSTTLANFVGSVLSHSLNRRVYGSRPCRSSAQMPPQFLYDYILFKVDVGGVTSHTREPLAVNHNNLISGGYLSYSSKLAKEFGWSDIVTTTVKSWIAIWILTYFFSIAMVYYFSRNWQLTFWFFFMGTIILSVITAIVISSTS